MYSFVQLDDVPTFTRTDFETGDIARITLPITETATFLRFSGESFVLSPDQSQIAIFVSEGSVCSPAIGHLLVADALLQEVDLVRTWGLKVAMTDNRPMLLVGWEDDATLLLQRLERARPVEEYFLLDLATGNIIEKP